MNLTIGTGEEVSNPTDEQIAHFLALLDGSGDSFAILAKNEMTYVQITGGPTSGFVLEYQLGYADQHYQSTRDDLPLATVESVFRSYARGEQSWMSEVEWAREDLSGGDVSGTPLLHLAIGALVLVGGILAWWYAA